MADKTSIQWTDATINFWHGCYKVSEGCRNCYMYRDKERWGQTGNLVIKGNPTVFKKALLYKEPKKIFANSWSDFFIKEADPWRAEAWDVIRRTPQHTWQILTKRPERIWECLPIDWGNGWNNVWLGISAEDHNTFSKRANALFYIPSKVKFISFEPLLGQIFYEYVTHPQFQWAIIGGESGNNTGKYVARPTQLEWIKYLISSLKKHNVKIFVKQLGTVLAKEMGCKDRHGGDPNEWPEHLRIREFPNESK